MLVKLSVRNFRNFSDWVEINLSTDKDYQFNRHAVENGVVKHSMVYGENGNGKSNLGLAILDLTCHLTDANIMPSLKANYLNASTRSDLAEFVYEFILDGISVVYKYGKEHCQSTKYESLTVDGTEIISIDRRVSDKATYKLSGSEGLKNDFSGREISPVKFVYSNSLLEDDIVSITFEKFCKYVDGMIFFRTLNRQKDYHGYPVDTKRMSQTIIENGKVSEFEEFLNKSGVECKLKISGSEGEEIIEFDFGERGVEFSQAASTGTMSLGNFYYWYMKLKSGDITFAYIDEFDAYYHFKLSAQIVEMISKLKCQTIITTHNLSLISNNILRPDCYFQLKHEKFAPLYSYSDRELRKAHNLEKMYRSGAFDE